MSKIEASGDQIGTPDLVVCLDSGAGNYEQLWVTTSLRGILWLGLDFGLGFLLLAILLWILDFTYFTLEFTLDFDRSPSSAVQCDCMPRRGCWYEDYLPCDVAIEVTDEEDEKKIIIIILAKGAVPSSPRRPLGHQLSRLLGQL